MKPIHINNYNRRFTDFRYKIVVLVWIAVSWSMTAKAQTTAFEYTGNVQTFTAPANGTYLIEAWGGRGGNILNYFPTAGGLGGFAAGKVSLSTGETIHIFVGGRGEDRLGNHPYGRCAYAPGGWNGGGGTRSAGNSTPGGGASDIRIGGISLANRVLVAAGGGGCGWQLAEGGDGGGLNGSNGTSYNGTGTGAFGGTQTAGGAMGLSFTDCLKSPGTLGIGGEGGGYTAGGGGGGGGYYGGGGGGFLDGGGGGSSYIGGVMEGQTTPGLRDDHGLVRITPIEVFETDADGDGFAASADCNDLDGTVYPGAPELCDGIDHNCDGSAFAAPVLTIESSSPSICVGDQVTLSAFVDGQPAWTEWSTGNFGESIDVAPGETTTYSAVFRDLNGCTSEPVDITIAVNARPSGSISGDHTICPGQVASIEIAISGSNGPWSGKYSDGINEVDFEGLSSPIMIPVTPSENTVYTLISLKDEYCPANSLNGSATVNVNRPPELSVPSVGAVANEDGECGATVSFTSTGTGEITYEIGESVPVSITSPYFFPVGTTTVTAIATNGCGTTRSSFYVTVDNAAPVITGVDISLDPQRQGANVPIIVSFDDNNAASGTIDWGDGTISEGIMGTSSFSGAHIYSTAGVYSVEARVTDACGLQASTLYQYVVIYEPYGGFVTGGGWFTSPEGAYAENPLATGKATFGFVSKYQKGASLPTGNTDFQFQSGGMAFSSTSYDWLVVAGYKAMFKGAGVFNGVAGHGFMVSAVDGNMNQSSSDKFRIKIWNSSGAVVYDNQMGSAENAEASTPIGGGSIVIHDPKGKDNSSAREWTQEVHESVERVSTRAYPNPFVNSVTIEYQSDSKDDLVVHVMDPTGRTVFERRYHYNAAGSYDVEFASSLNAHQMYFLKISQGRRMELVKVMKR